MATTRTVTGSTWVVHVTIERIDKVVIKDEYDRTSTASLVPMDETTEELQVKAQQASLKESIYLAIAMLRLRAPDEAAS